MENEILEVKPAEEKTVGINSIEVKSIKQKVTPTLTLFQDSVNVWWKNLKKFVQIYLWGLFYSLIPMAVIFLGVLAISFMGASLSLALKTVILILVIAGIFITIYFYIQSYIGMFLLVKKNYEGEAKQIFKEAKASILPYITLTLLTGILLLLWTLLLIIPGIIFSVFYSFAVYVFFFEGKTGMSAIKRSKELVKGYWLVVAGRFGFLALVVWLFSVIISVPMLVVPEHSLFWEIWNALVQVISMLIGPITLKFSYQNNQHLVKIKK